MAPKPVIGLTADIEGFESPKRKGKERFFLKEAYFNAIFLAGGVPLLIPAYSQSVRSSAYFQMIDGLVVTGGYFDIDPRLYGERPEFRIDELKPERTKLEIYLIKKARKAGIPQLGVCGGMQAMNVAFGGSLYQDIPSQLHSAIKHEQKPSPVTKPTHKVNIV
ncbi:MAG: gamma-glutamyl-gamma-aminobutyrate hydrolase family protein, partial [Nitrospinota bacterium]|nr:gamma-glutamyl-gamma-aminobutyrate hydrolase family protein [Nitrospinota bacterium]